MKWRKPDRSSVPPRSRRFPGITLGMEEVKVWSSIARGKWANMVLVSTD